MAVDARAAAGDVGRVVAELDLSSVWAVDPSSGREGPADLVVRDGRLESVMWLEGADADGIDANGVAVRMALLYLLAGTHAAGTGAA